MMTQLLKLFFISLVYTFLLNHFFNQPVFAQSDISVAELIALTNLSRQNQSLPALKPDPRLTQAAENKAADMLQNGYFSHLNLSDEPPWIYLQQVGYEYTAAGENLARDYSNSQAVINAWLNSPSHRDNLLGSQYTDIGLAVVRGNTPQGKSTTLIVQLLAAPLSLNSQAIATSSGSYSAAAILAPHTLPLPLMFLLIPIILAAIWFTRTSATKVRRISKPKSRRKLTRFHPPPALWQA